MASAAGTHISQFVKFTGYSPFISERDYDVAVIMQSNQAVMATMFVEKTVTVPLLGLSPAHAYIEPLIRYNRLCHTSILTNQGEVMAHTTPMKALLSVTFLDDQLFGIFWAKRDRFSKPGLYIDVWGKERRVLAIPAISKVIEPHE